MSHTDSTTFALNDKKYDLSVRHPIIIAEAGLAHEGSLGQAIAFAEIAKQCGADAIKYQTHIADAESTCNEPWRIRFSRQDASRYDYWKRTSFNIEEWKALKSATDKIGISFLSSPFSVEACKLLEQLGMTTWKVASGEVYNDELLNWLNVNARNVIISSGLSDIAKTQKVLEMFLSKHIPTALLHCISEYPTEPLNAGLQLIEQYKSLFPHVLIGLSDHSGSILPPTIATYLGASVLEVHLTLSKMSFGPDTSSSLDPKEFLELVNSVKYSWQLRMSTVSKEFISHKMEHYAIIFGRSLVARRDLEEGHTITHDDVAYKKPGGGIQYSNLSDIVGKTTLHAIAKDQKFKYDDIA